MERYKRLRGANKWQKFTTVNVARDFIKDLTGYMYTGE